MTDLPKCPQKSSFKVSLKADEKYYWCTCGLSQNQPFCDGLHKGSGFKSLAFEAPKTELVSLCGCKRTKTPPYCDGSHNFL